MDECRAAIFDPVVTESPEKVVALGQEVEPMKPALMRPRILPGIKPCGRFARPRIGSITPIRALRPYPLLPMQLNRLNRSAYPTASTETNRPSLCGIHP